MALANRASTWVSVFGFLGLGAFLVSPGSSTYGAMLILFLMGYFGKKEGAS